MVMHTRAASYATRPHRVKQISEDKIYTMLMELEPHKATGLDGLQAKFLIDSAQSIKNL